MTIGESTVQRARGGWIVSARVSNAQKLIDAGFHPQSRGVAFAAMCEPITFVPDDQVPQYVAQFPEFAAAMVAVNE